MYTGNSEVRNSCSYSAVFNIFNCCHNWIQCRVNAKISYFKWPKVTLVFVFLFCHKLQQSSTKHALLESCHKQPLLTGILFYMVNVPKKNVSNTDHIIKFTTQGCLCLGYFLTHALEIVFNRFTVCFHIFCIRRLRSWSSMLLETCK